MGAIILALIQQLNSSVFILVALLLVSFYGLYKIGGIVTYFKESKEKNEKSETRMEGMKDSISAIKATTDLLYQAHLSTVQRQSPIALTPKGVEVSEAISAGVKINNHWDRIKREVEKRNPKNPYDIQTVSMDIARFCFDSILTKDEQNEIKTYSYNTGMNLLEIYPVLGVLIRDRIFKEDNIKPDDVDKHDPNVSTQ